MWLMVSGKLQQTLVAEGMESLFARPGVRSLAVGSEEHLTRLYNELLNKDWFMTFLDFKSYVKTKDQAFKDYEDRTAWAKKMLVNIAKAGFFSSDRTIAEYNHDIWHLK